jgi:hypothetical protein
MTDPLYRLEYDAEFLMERYPPVLRHQNKSIIWEMAHSQSSGPTGKLQVTRWETTAARDVSLPQSNPVAVRTGYYDYAPRDGAGTAVEWHVNFADPRLFVAYGSGLFAQDEMQVAEHPILGSLLEAMKREGHSTWTCDDSGPTPILVQGAERRVAVQTDPDPQAGRPLGLYGNRFAAADEETIRRATRVIEPPTITNLIAIAAPSGGAGEYHHSDIRDVLAAALTGFAAARRESHRALGPTTRVVVHSGFWGCGAFGGNRVLMIALQSLAARAAGIDELILHVGEPSGLEIAQRGLDVADALALRCGPQSTLDKLIDRCQLLGYRWGVSDGN